MAWSLAPSSWRSVSTASGSTGEPAACASLIASLSSLILKAAVAPAVAARVEPFSAATPEPLHLRRGLEHRLRDLVAAELGRLGELLDLRRGLLGRNADAAEAIHRLRDVLPAHLEADLYVRLHLAQASAASRIASSSAFRAFASSSSAASKSACHASRSPASVSPSSPRSASRSA